jgi:hypothetical protein
MPPYRRLCVVSLVPSGPKVSSLLVCDWPHSVWTKSFVCKDAVLQGIPLFRRFCTACKSEDFRFPVSHLDDRTIPSGRSSVHCSICPNDVPYCPDAQTELASFVRTTWISVWTLYCIEKLLFQLASVRTSQ